MTTAIREFSQELHDATALAHDKAENSTFISELIEGKRSAADFQRLQEQAWFFYKALEDATRRVRAQYTDEVVQDLLDPRLDRVSALERDLDALLGDSSWRETLEPLPATRAYVQRLESVETLPELVAHHYVRYLGDLSGGQVIATMMRRHYGIDPAALHFYEFPELGKLKPYKDNYRYLLNRLDFDGEQRRTALAEAEVAFELNSAVFKDLC